MYSTTIASRSQTPLCDAPRVPSPAFESPESSLTHLSDFDSPRRSSSYTFGESSSRSVSMAAARHQMPGAVCPDFPPPLPKRNLAYVLAPAPSHKRRTVPDGSDPPPKRRKKGPPGIRFGVCTLFLLRSSGRSDMQYKPNVPAPAQKSGKRDAVRVVRQPRPMPARARSSPLGVNVASSLLPESNS